jgi:hypothetical protein
MTTFGNRNQASLMAYFVCITITRSSLKLINFDGQPIL